MHALWHGEQQASKGFRLKCIKVFMLGLYAEFCKTTRIANTISRVDLCIKVCNLVINEFCMQNLYAGSIHSLSLFLWKFLCLYAYAHKLLCMAKTFTWYAFYTSLHQICIYCRRLVHYHTNLYMVRVLFYALSLLYIIAGALFMHYHCRRTFDALSELVQLEAFFFFFSLHIVYSCFFFIHCWVNFYALSKHVYIHYQSTFRDKLILGLHTQASMHG
jgi:hypothetical protein